MAYGPPPSPGPGQQPGWQQPSQWQQPGPPPGAAPGGAPQGRSTAQMPGHFGPVSHDDKTWSLMAYVGQFVVGAIAPAIVYVGKGRSPFVRQHAAQGLNMGLGAIAVWLVVGLLSLALDDIFWFAIAYTAAVLFFLVYAARPANRGEFRRVPKVIAWPLVK